MAHSVELIEAELAKASQFTESTQSSHEDDKDIAIILPEGLVSDLDLSKHTEGSWPSSKNVSQ
jgi:hypothetical protein